MVQIFVLLRTCACSGRSANGHTSLSETPKNRALWVYKRV